MRRCEDEKMWRWEDVKMRRCEDEQMWRWEDVKMWGCEDEKMWRCEDVKMWGCENERMWRREDVKMRRCEDEKMWRWEDVKMRRCLTDPHYWKNPALRRSREKEPSKRSQDSWSKKMTPVIVRIRWIRPNGIMTQNPQDAAATVMFYHVLTLRVGQHPQHAVKPFA